MTHPRTVYLLQWYHEDDEGHADNVGVFGTLEAAQAHSDTHGGAGAWKRVPWAGASIWWRVSSRRETGTHHYIEALPLFGVDES